MDAEKILSLPKHHRRTFIAFLILICVVLIFVDFTFIRMAPESFRSDLSGYVQSITGAIFVALIVLWIFISFIPLGEDSGGLHQIEPNRITGEFEDLLKDAQRWRYKGNFGRYQRGKVLPTLAGTPNLHVSINIIDPNNQELCREHAQYRNKINSIDKGKRYDADNVSLEVVVTIIHCAWYVANKGVMIDLFLSSVFDPVRIDSNDKAMILTVEDRRSPALKLTSKHFMYNHFELQMRYAREQGRRIDLGGFAERATIAAIEEEDVRLFLTGIAMQELCERLTPTEIVAACRGARNPYED